MNKEYNGIQSKAYSTHNMSIKGKNTIIYHYMDTNVDGKKVLDLGCGDADWIKFLASKGAECVGIDLSRDLLDIGQKSIEPNSNITLYQGDVFDLNYKKFHLKSKSFDVVCLSMITPLASSEEKLLKLLSDSIDLLRDDGLLFIMTPNENNIPGIYKTKDGKSIHCIAESLDKYNGMKYTFKFYRENDELYLTLNDVYWSSELIRDIIKQYKCRVSSISYLDPDRLKMLDKSHHNIFFTCMKAKKLE